MVKKIIILLTSLMMLTFLSGTLYAQTSDSCTASVKTGNANDVNDLKKCLEDNLHKKRQKLIEDFKKIRKIPGGGMQSSGGGEGPAPQSAAPTLAPAPSVTTPVQPVVTQPSPQPPAPTPQPPQIHYNY